MIDKETWLSQEYINESAINSTFAISDSWLPMLQVRQNLDKKNINDEKQIEYFKKFIELYAQKSHMLRKQEEWNNYFYEYCINQEILKFNESGNSPFCAHDI